MSYTGLYINLDRSTERRSQIESHLAQLGLEATYHRFPAALGNSLSLPNPKLTPGILGAFISQYLLLKENIGNPQPLHIIEDDVLLAGCMKQSILDLIGKGLFDTYDIIYTDTQIPTSNVYYKTYKNLFDKVTKCDESGRVKEATFQMIDLRDGKFGTTSSLLISPKAIKKLHDMYEAELTRGAQMPPDLFLWQHIAQNNLRAACIFPFITSLRLEYSLNTTMPGRYDQLSILARDIVRVSFFVDRDLNVCREYIAKYLALPNDPHLQILLQVLGFSFTDKFIDI